MTNAACRAGRELEPQCKALSSVKNANEEVFPSRLRYLAGPGGPGRFLVTVVGGVDPAQGAPITLVVKWSSQLSSRH
jgi:hypothetical protein